MKNQSSEDKLEDILQKVTHKGCLTKNEIIFLLRLDKPQDIEKLFACARRLRSEFFEHKVFLYGFVYFSTHCRNNCTFCLYRKSNHLLKRYRKTEAEILKTAYSLAESGVHLLDLTMGEDPNYFDRCNGFEELLGVIEKIKRNTNLPLMISPGVVKPDILAEFKTTGIDWYACYQETYNMALFKRLRVGQSYSERYMAKVMAKSIGLLLEEGLLTGVGDTFEDVADSLLAMGNLGVEQVRVMSFVPQKATPMEQWASPPRINELLIIAAMRLLYPEKLIPASLDVEGISGLKRRLDAGANVVTSIIPPHAGLAGVSNSSLDIEEGNRTVPRVISILEQCGLEPSQAEYINWISSRVIPDPICRSVP